MKNHAEFLFYSVLNDFLEQEKRQKTFLFSFTGKPAVKDCIEAIGIPHTEVEIIIVNDKSVGFNYKLKNGDKVSVFPVFSNADIKNIIPLREPLNYVKFIVDANIGKMAKYLRMLGFDTLYEFSLPDKEIVALAESEKRIILTRDIGLLKRKNAIHGYFLRKKNIEEQVLETIYRFNLITLLKPFTICLECNGTIAEVAKNEIKDQVKSGVYEDYEQFFSCLNCGKIYWKGSHYDTMMAKINKFKKVTSDR